MYNSVRVRPPPRLRLSGVPCFCCCRNELQNTITKPYNNRRFWSPMILSWLSSSGFASHGVQTVQSRRSTGSLAMSVKSETPCFSDIHWRSRLSFSRGWYSDAFDFLKKKFDIFVLVRVRVGKFLFFFKKSNASLCPFMMWKDSLLRQRMSEKRCVSLFTPIKTPCTSGS